MSTLPREPFNYNLLELYRQHRDEIDTLTDQTSLFILAFTNQIGSATLDDLARDVNFSPNLLRSKLTPLLRGKLMNELNGSFTVTALGRHLLSELGFIPPVPPGSTQSPRQPEPPTEPHHAKLVRRPDEPVKAVTKPATPGWVWSLAAFLGTGVVFAIIAIIAILLWPQPTPPAPILQVAMDFSAERTDLVAGDCTMLHWNVQNAAWVELNGQRVNNPDAQRVCPNRTTTYRLIAGGGLGASRDVVINVSEQPTVVSPSPVTVPPPPDIQITFTADRTSIQAGECAVLRWEVRGSSVVELNGQHVNPIDQTRVCPKQTTLYRLAVDNGKEWVLRELTISVATAQPSPPGEVKGSVVRAIDQKAIPGARIEISSGQAVTSVDGNYGFPGLPPGNYTVAASAPGYTPQRQSINIASGQSATLNFILNAAPVDRGNGVKITAHDCYSFDKATFVDCTTPYDLIVKQASPTILLRGNLAVANPQNDAYESCKNIVGSDIDGAYKGEYICAMTKNSRVAVMYITAIEQTPIQTIITFDWVRY